MATMKRCFLIALAACAALVAQAQPAQTQPAQTQPAQEQPAQTPSAAAPKPQAPSAQAPKGEEESVLKPQVYVRRFSAGMTLTVAPVKPLFTRDQSINIESPALSAAYATVPVPHRVGWGFTGQIALTERFAVNANVLFKHAGYKANQSIVEGVDNPNTVADERKYTNRDENTSAKYMDIPITVRYYTKDRHTPGPRGFFELGGALRTAQKVSTSITTTVTTANGETDTTSNTTAPYRKSIRGVVAGAGIQLIDPVGIRVVPEVRYTYWMNATFNNLTNVSTRHQVEAMISLTF